MERGYRAYASIRDEQALKGMVQKEWESRYHAETEQALAVRKSRDFGGQIEALRQEIASLRTENMDLQKSATPSPTQTSVRVPTNEEFGAMGTGLDAWKATEALARRALRGD
jgi:hypothetical protein